MIVHLDMDAFFASVEQMDDPNLRGKPVIIGGGKRGVVSTASYEARRYGVHSAMPVATARKLCPQGIFVRGRMSRYAELSRAIMAALGEFSPLVEPASIDEAYLDATGMERVFGPLDVFISRLKARVAEASGGLTCSVGAAPVKFLAKICSDINKPDGVFVLPPHEVDAFLATLAVQKLPGVGKRMQADLRSLGIATVGQLRAYSRDFLEGRYGKWGGVLHDRAHGIDPRPVVTERMAKSESAECTFEQDVTDRALLERALLAHAERVGARLRRHSLRGRTVTLKVKYADFTQLTRSRTLQEGIHSTQTIFDLGCQLLAELDPCQPVRLVGLGVSGFGAQAAQQLLLPGHKASTHEPTDAVTEAKRDRLDRALDDLRRRFGKEAVQRGRLFDNA